MPRILVVGHLTLDAICNQVNSTAHFNVPQGAGLGSAVGAVTSGARVELAAVAGADYPMDVFSSLEGAGIGLELVERAPHGSLRFWLLRESETYCTDMPYSSTLIAKYTPSPAQWRHGAKGRFDAVHICPMPILDQIQWVDAVRNDVELVSVDPQPFRYAPEQQSAPRLFASLAGRVDVLSISLEDFPDLGQDPPSALSALKALGPTVVTLKMGRRGSVVATRNSDSYFLVPALEMELGDETGAGDAYAGAFLGTYSATRNPSGAARRATATASAMIEQVGMTHLLNRLDRIQSLEKNCVCTEVKQPHEAV